MRIQDNEKNMSHLGRIYQKGKQLDDLDEFACLHMDETLYYRKQLKKEFDQILETLPSVQSMILCNDYLNPVEEDWWRNFYPAGKYYRLKNIAIDAFFHCLYT